MFEVQIIQRALDSRIERTGSIDAFDHDTAGIAQRRNCELSRHPNLLDHRSCVSLPPVSNDISHMGNVG